MKKNIPKIMGFFGFFFKLRKHKIKSWKMI